MPVPHRAVDAEIHACVSHPMRAFFDDPVLRWLYPDDDEFAADSPR